LRRSTDKPLTRAQKFKERPERPNRPTGSANCSGVFLLSRRFADRRPEQLDIVDEPERAATKQRSQSTGVSTGWLASRF